MTEVSAVNAVISAIVTPRWRDLNTPVNTPATLMCACQGNDLVEPGRALFMWFATASQNCQLPVACVRLNEMLTQWDGLAVSPIQEICGTYILQTWRAEDFDEAVRVLTVCAARGVPRSLRLYRSLFQLFTGAANEQSGRGPQASLMLRILQTVASSCEHAREHFGTFASQVIRRLVDEHRVVEAMRLFDLLLDIARVAPSQFSVGSVLERHDDLWQAMFTACRDQNSAVQMIALWRAALQFHKESRDRRAMLLLVVARCVTEITAGSLQAQYAIGWAAVESLVPADWLRFVIDVAVDGPGSHFLCSQKELDAVLLAAIKCKLFTTALPLVRAVVARPTEFGFSEDTFANMLAIIAGVHDRQLESLADSVLALARDNGQLSSSAVVNFMKVMIVCNRTDKALELYEYIKTINVTKLLSGSVSALVLATVCVASNGDFAELKRAFDALVHFNGELRGEIRVIMHTSAINSAQLDEKFAPTAADAALMSHRSQRAATKGDFASALKGMAELPGYLRVVHFVFLVEKVVQQANVNALPAVVAFARQHDIEWSPPMVFSVVRLCYAVENIDFAVEFVASFEEAQRAKKNRSSSELDVFRSQLLNSLRENGPQQLALMIKLLNAWVARGPVEADHASIVVVAAFRAAAHNLGWQVYRTLIEKTQSLSDVHCASVIREGVRFVDELWAVMDEFEEHGVTMSGEVWTSAFDTIDKRMRSSALAMQAFERMNQQQPVVNAASAYASAIGCLDALVSVEAVLAHMRAAQVTPNASLFLAVLRFCRRELQLELAERMMLEYIRTDDAAWYIDIFRVHEEIVGAVAAVAFQRQHAEAIGVKRSGVKASRLAPVSNDDHVQKRRAL
jgi:hypothetical protein